MSRACLRAGATNWGRPGNRAAPFLFSDQSGTLIGMQKTIVLIALLLTACGEDRPPAPTEAENRQLNEADVMLNEAAGNEGR